MTFTPQKRRSNKFFNVKMVCRVHVIMMWFWSENPARETNNTKAYSIERKKMPPLKRPKRMFYCVYEYRCRFQIPKIKVKYIVRTLFSLSKPFAIVTDFENRFNFNVMVTTRFFMKNHFDFCSVAFHDYCSKWHAHNSEPICQSLCSFILTWKQLSKWQKNGVYNLFVNWIREQAQKLHCDDVFCVSVSLHFGLLMSINITVAFCIKWNYITEQKKNGNKT